MGPCAEPFGYVVQFRPNQVVKKGKQVASSSKLGLAENVVLRLMECLTPTVSFYIFMDNYFTSFRLLTHLGVNNIRALVCTTKIGYPNALSLGTNSCKKGTKLLWTAHIKQKGIATLRVVSWNKSRVVCITSFESCQPKIFVWCWNKV